MFPSDVVTSRDSGPAQEAGLQLRRKAGRSAAGILGVAEVRFGAFPDNRMDGLELLIVARVVESHVREFSPAIVFTHFSGDLNVDHPLTHEAVMTACRPQPTASVVTVLQFETTSSTEWRGPSASFAFWPDWFVDIASTIDINLRALAPGRSLPQTMRRPAASHTRWTPHGRAGTRSPDAPSPRPTSLQWPQRSP